jgi:hypothetical protein
VAGEVRLREQAKPGNSAGAGELMPLRLAYGPKAQSENNMVEKLS